MGTQDPQRGPDPGLQRSAWWWVRAAAVLITLFVAYQLLLVVRSWVEVLLRIVLYFVFGLVVAFIASPGVNALRRGGVPKHAAILLTLAGGVALVLGVLYLIGGPLVSEVHGLIDELPRVLARGQHYYETTLGPQLAQHGIALDPKSQVGALIGFATGHVPALLINGVQTTLQVAVDVVVVLVVAFYLLSGGAELRATFLSWLPAAVRDDLEFAFDAVERVLGGYVRAQLVMAILIGVLAGGGCAIVGVPFPLFIGVAAGVFELVPILGPFLGGAVAVALALTKSPFLALEAVGVFLVIHVIEGYLLAPRIQGHFTRIHPLVAFLAIFAGIEVGGLLGALFAVPVVALAFVFIRATLGDWRAHRPELFRGSAGDPYIETRRKRLLEEFRFRPREMLRGARRRFGLG